MKKNTRARRTVLLSLASVVAVGCVVPAVASAAPAPADAPAPATTTPTAPTSTTGSAASTAAAANSTQSVDWVKTKGTSLTLHNHTGKTIWVRSYDYAGAWNRPVELRPGATRNYQGNWPGTDDVELRIFKSEETATGNSVFRAYEVDAENPAYSQPWMSVSCMSRYFGVGDTTHWYSAGWLGDAEFWGKRHEDSQHYKQFELHMKSMG